MRKKKYVQYLINEQVYIASEISSKFSSKIEIRYNRLRVSNILRIEMADNQIKLFSENKNLMNLLKKLDEELRLIEVKERI